MPVYKFLQSSQQEVVGNVHTDDIADGAVTRAKLSADIQAQLSSLAATGIETLDLTVYGYNNAVWPVLENQSFCVRHGTIVFVTIDIHFTASTAYEFSGIHGLPFVASSVFTGSVLAVRVETGDNDFVTVRPALDPGAVEYGGLLFGFNPPATGNYAIYGEFFYFTDGSTTYADYLAQVESENNYIAQLTSSNFYQAVI